MHFSHHRRQRECVTGTQWHRHAVDNRGGCDCVRGVRHKEQRPADENASLVLLSTLSQVCPEPVLRHSKTIIHIDQLRFSISFLELN